MNQINTALLRITLLALTAASGHAQATLWTDYAEWRTAMGSTQVADFEGYTGSVTNQHPGVTFAPLAGGAPIVFNTTSFFTPQAVSGTGFLLGQSSGPSYGGGAFAMQFSPPVEGVGLWIGGLHPFPGSTIRLLAPNGTLLDQIVVPNVLPAMPFHWQFLGMTVAPDFAIATVEYVVDNADYAGFDDVEFGNVVDAGCTLRNGSGINPADLTCASPPNVGGTCVLDIQPTPNTVATFAIVAFATLPAPVPALGGELLIDPNGIALPGSNTHAFAVPATDPSLLGLELFVQGLRLDANVGGLDFALLNALDLVVGY